MSRSTRGEKQKPPLSRLSTVAEQYPPGPEIRAVETLGCRCGWTLTKEGRALRPLVQKGRTIGGRSSTIASTCASRVTQHRRLPPLDAPIHRMSDEWFHACWTSRERPPSVRSWPSRMIAYRHEREPARWTTRSMVRPSIRKNRYNRLLRSRGSMGTIVVGTPATIPRQSAGRLC